MSFSFIHITDHHLPESETGLVRGFSPVYAFQTVLRHIAANTAAQADFIISTGDMVETPSEAGYQTLAHLLHLPAGATQAPGPLRISLEGLRDYPFYCLPGNHDDRGNFFRGLFPGSPPAPLMNAAFVHQGVQFICLDWGSHSKAVTHRETLDFLAHSLETNLPAVLLMHYQVTLLGNRNLDRFLADDVDLFWKIVTGRQVLGIFCGHAHATYEKIVAGIPVFGLRSIAFPLVVHEDSSILSPHYRFVTIHNGILTTRIFEVPL